MVWQYFISITVISGLAILWRQWLYDHPGWKKQIAKRSTLLDKALGCGLCFTFWTSLIYLAIFNPGFDIAPLRFDLPILSASLEFLAKLAALTFGAGLLRFSFALVSELVHYVLHDLNKRSH